MKSTFSIALMLVITGFCWAQNSGSSAPSQNASPNGSMPSQQASAAGEASNQAAVIPVQLAKSIDSRKVKQGDPVEAKIAAELRTGDGTVIPRGSKVMGHVTEASARAKGDPSSQLGLVFDQISLKDGKQLPLKASIQAVGPAPSAGAAPTEMGDASGAPSQGASAPMGGATSPSGMGTTRSTLPAPNSGSEPQSSQPDHRSSPQLTQQSTGVVGLHDLQLEKGSIFASNGKQVKLDAGSEMLLRVQNQ